MEGGREGEWERWKGRREGERDRGKGEEGGGRREGGRGRREEGDRVLTYTPLGPTSSAHRQRHQLWTHGLKSYDTTPTVQTTWAAPSRLSPGCH